MPPTLRSRAARLLVDASGPMWLAYLRLFRRAVVEVCLIQVALIVTFTVIYTCTWIVGTIA